MKYSLKWLQTYSKEALPDPKKIEELVTFNAFEIESVEELDEDTIFDIKVLPNRAHDALGHRGMARDIVALTGNTFVDPNEYYEGEGDSQVTSPIITTEDTKACTRFMSVRIDGIQVTESPEWLKTALNAIGQKSINSIVDITNYVQFSLNKPMHAYDAQLIASNTLTARLARAGEVLTTLDDKELTLDATTLVIADIEKPLGLAGIKGGKFSGISDTTSSIILESANFNPTLIRKTAQKYGIRTDASKRFENEISDELVEEGLRMTIALVQKLNSNAKVSSIVDVWNRKPWEYTVSVSLREINGVLGTSYGKEEVANVFSSLGFPVTISTARQVIEEQLEKANDAAYKNPSSMRADAPDAFSCSSLMSYLFSGIWQPSIAIDKYVYGEKVTEPVWGDLVFSNSGLNETGTFRTQSVAFLPQTDVGEPIDHVGVYVGDNQVYHISSQSVHPVTETITESAYFKSGVRYARMVDVDEERFFVTVPHDRLDIRIKEDVIEEVGRMKGLSTIKGVLPVINRTGVPHKRLYYENKIKNILHKNGFSEIMTYSFGDVGEIEIVKGLATDKEKLRDTLSGGVQKAFQMNMLNAPLLNIQTVKMYEFGNVFTKDTERRHLALVIDDGKKKSTFNNEVDMILSEIKRDLGVSTILCETISAKPYIVELDFDTLIESLPEPTSYEPLTQNTDSVAYRAVSPYPFIVRDIAVWVPASVAWEDIHKFALQINSPLIIRIDCFDTFTKEVEGVQKTSYGFRFVLQAPDRTLTDAEANEIADQMYSLLKDKGFEIR